MGKLSDLVDISGIKNTVLNVRGILSVRPMLSTMAHFYLR